MKTIVAGSREGVTFEDVVDAWNECPWQITCVVSGCASGVDSFGEEIAKKNNIPIDPYPADWTKYGKAAGPIRNKLMAENAEALLAIWDGQSKGTLDMIKTAQKMKLKVWVYTTKGLPF